MMIYKVMLVLFLFGAVVGGLNSSEIFSYKMPETGGATITETQVSEVANSTQNQGLGGLTLISTTFLFLGVIYQGIQAVAFVSPILLSYGIPGYFTGIIQVGIWLVEIFGLYQLATGNIGVEK